ncbi:MAG: hypothetical protein LR011_09040 [Verrucomicrobia bacterium]|nr:hypothetical protein [Verrucomicrobiota bacterium]
MNVAALVAAQRSHPYIKQKQTELESVMTAEWTQERTVGCSIALAFHGFLAGCDRTFETGCGLHKRDSCANSSEQLS